jgi:hypothetical protein
MQSMIGCCPDAYRMSPIRRAGGAKLRTAIAFGNESLPAAIFRASEAANVDFSNGAGEPPRAGGNAGIGRYLPPEEWP